MANDPEDLKTVTDEFIAETIKKPLFTWVDWLGFAGVGAFLIVLVVFGIMGHVDREQKLEEQRQARLSLADVTDCERAGVLIDNKGGDDIVLRGMYECDDGTDTPRYVFTPPE